jgi:hypothetical protein
LRSKPPKAPRSAEDLRAAAREATKRSALNALKRAKRTAEKAGIKLSEWEDEFIGSVSERIDKYGRAFADPEKGSPGQALSGNQAIKLKEIVRKAKGEKRQWPQRRNERKGFGRKAEPEPEPED